MAEDADGSGADGGKLDVLLEDRADLPAAAGVRGAGQRLRPRRSTSAADEDFEAWWASWAEKLDWIEPWDEVLDWSDPPFAKWFVGGKLNASANCLDRHVDAGNGDRIALYWEGEDADRREVTYAELLEMTQRFANVLKGLGVGKGDVVGIYLPMLPETVAAMLGCARIGAIHNVVFGGFSAESVKERMQFSDAKALVTADATMRRGKPIPMKAAVDEIAGEIADARAHRRRQPRRHRPADDRGPRRLLARRGRRGRRRVRARADGRRGPALHPLHLGLDRQAEGDPPHHRRLPDPGQRHPQARLRPQGQTDVYWCGADIGWVTGHSYIVYGPLANGATSVMYEGAPNFPAEDRWWEIVERYKVSIFYTAPTAIRACMKWGVRAPRRSTTSPRCACWESVGEPINPRAWLWYHENIGGGRCPIVDTWWQTETGAIMITPLPGLTTTKPGSATIPFPGIEAKIFDEDGQGDRGGRRDPRPDPALARRWRAPSTRRRSASSRPTGTATAATPTWSATPPAATRTATSGSSAGSTT